MNTNPIVKIPGFTNIQFGAKEIPIIAGPCSIESQEQLLKIAQTVKNLGASLLRGGIYKMRTNPNSFQGLGDQAYSFLNEVKSQIEMPLISEIIDPRQISDMMGSVDIFQVGSRNMYNYALLKELGKTNKPVMLKRGFAATIEEWVNAANYLIQGGNSNVILCERGIRTFETATRNTLDLNAVAYIKAHTQFPIVVDPSHGTGRPELIKAMAAAAIAAGADGIMLEVHHEPAKALSDAFQALNFEQFADVVVQCRNVAHAVGRSLVSDLK